MQGTSPPYFVDDGAAAGCGFTDGAPTLPWADPTASLHQPAGLHAVGVAAPVGRLALPPRRDGDSDRVLGDTGPPLQRELPVAGRRRLFGVHRVEPGPGGADRPLRRRRRDPLDLAVLRRRDALQPGRRLQPDRRGGRRRSSPTSRSTTSTPCSTRAGRTPRVVDGIPARAADGVHITQAAVDNLIEPALNQIIANVAGAVYAGNA